MTEHATETEKETYRPTLGELSHTNPYTDEVFGVTQTYSRGRTIAADGGEANAVPDEGDGEDGTETGTGDEREVLKDVSHEPPNDSESANRVHSRGREPVDETEE